MNITVYTITSSPFCTALKEYLAQNNIPFVEKNVEQNRDFLQEMLDVSDKFPGVPFTVISKDNGEVVKIRGFTKTEFDAALTIEIPSVADVSTSQPTSQPVSDIPTITPTAEPVVQPAPAPVHAPTAEPSTPSSMSADLTTPQPAPITAAPVITEPTPPIDPMPEISVSPAPSSPAPDMIKAPAQAPTEPLTEPVVKLIDLEPLKNDEKITSEVTEPQNDTVVPTIPTQTQDTTTPPITTDTPPAPQPATELKDVMDNLAALSTDASTKQNAPAN